MDLFYCCESFWVVADFSFRSLWLVVVLLEVFLDCCGWLWIFLDCCVSLWIAMNRCVLFLVSVSKIRSFIYLINLFGKC